jgi:hypothetical protein
VLVRLERHITARRARRARHPLLAVRMGESWNATGATRTGISICVPRTVA